MTTQDWTLITLALASVVLLVVLVTRFKVNAFIALALASLLVGAQAPNCRRRFFWRHRAGETLHRILRPEARRVVRHGARRRRRTADVVCRGPRAAAPGAHQPHTRDEGDRKSVV